MYETIVTLVGRLITPLKQVFFDDGSLKVTGRVACNARRYDRSTGQWIDGKKLYLTVVCWRGLAENAFSSLRSGDPVLVHGQLHTREYVKDGVQNSVIELEAWSIGPDLQGCTAALTKKPRPAAQGPGEDGVSSQTRGSSGGGSWETGSQPDGEPDDRPDPDDIRSEDPWAEHVSVGGPTVEAAVGV